jgi:hypothetical protein
LIVSDLLAEEVMRAPDDVKNVFNDLPDDGIEPFARSNETERLRDLYIAAGVVTEKSLNDAHHVAIASVARADLIVSWNFKHIVHFDKIRGFHSVNLREGYPCVDIRSPKEVI